jgi:hypothetical protein
LREQFLEEAMLKPVIAATAVLAIAGSSLVYAQHRSSERDGVRPWGPRTEQRHRPNPEDLAAFTDARIAALRAGLKLTPDQAKSWPPFEQALREAAQLRIQRLQTRLAAAPQQGENAQPQQGGAEPQQGQAPANPFDRLGRRADGLAKAGAALKKVAETGAPLYQSLTDAQKQRFTRLARMLRPHFRHFAFNDREGGWRGGHGFRRDGEGVGPEHRRFAPNGSDDRGGPDSQL